MNITDQLTTINENIPKIYEAGKNEAYAEITEKSKITQTFEGVNEINTPLITSIHNVTFRGNTTATKISDDTIPRYSITETNGNIKLDCYNVNRAVSNYSMYMGNKLYSLPGYDDCFDSCKITNASKYVDITKKVSKVTLNGDSCEKWFKKSDMKNLYFCEVGNTTGRFSDTEIQSIKNGNGLLKQNNAFSNWFGKMDQCCKPNVINGWTIENFHSSTMGYCTRIHIQTDTITTLDELKTKLAETPFTFYYLSVDGDKAITTSNTALQIINEQLSDGTIDTVRFTPYGGVAETSTDLIKLLQNTGKIEVANNA